MQLVNRQLIKQNSGIALHAWCQFLLQASSLSYHLTDSGYLAGQTDTVENTPGNAINRQADIGFCEIRGLNCRDRFFIEFNCRAPDCFREHSTVRECQFIPDNLLIPQFFS